jgi:hypothetical protein
MLRLKKLLILVFIGIDELYQELNSVLFQKILRIREVGVEEYRVEHFGTIIHETLKSLYDPFVGGLFQNQIFIQQIDDEVLKQFKVVYKKK